MSNLIFRFAKQVVSLAQKRCAASPTAVRDPTGHGAPRGSMSHCIFRVHMDATYREIADWANEIDRLRDLLQLARMAFPAPATMCRSFERIPMSLWRDFLRKFAKRCEPRSHGELMPHSPPVKRHRDTTNTARIATYARSKRRP